jgi:hypothetical protein
MVVVAFVGVMVNRFTINLAPEHTAQIHQEIEGAVDCRFVDAGHPGLNEADNFISSQVVAGRMDNVQDQLALGGQLESIVSKNVTATHCYCTWLQL